MKKLLCMLLMLSMLLSLASCAKADAGIHEDAPASYDAINSGIAPAPSGGTDADPVSPTDDDMGASLSTSTYAVASTTVAATWSAEMEAALDAAVEASKAAAEASKAAASAVAEGAKVPEATMSVPMEPGVAPAPQVGAGMLTAGEWKDLEDIAFWQKVLNNNEWYSLMEFRGLFANKIVPVKIVDGNGNPCFNVPVSLTDEGGKIIYSAVSDVDGMAYLLYDLDNTKQTAGHIVIGGVQYDIAAQGQTVVNLASAGVSATKLDLLFMIDTTGSMGDELSYLKAELRDVIRKVAQAGQIFSINLSVNFYRDTGDEYVVRSFEFTSDIDKAIEQLSRQEYNGGGDYAEAVHLALDDIVHNHQWRDGAVKLCFMVLDAPPHTAREIAGIDDKMQTTVMTMAEQGIRFIPLASSGVNTETEFLLRSWAVMTGGTYTFLTNHSGIGNSHLEPTIGQYEVEKLNDLLVRVICEYCAIK